MKRYFYKVGGGNSLSKTDEKHLSKTNNNKIFFFTHI